MKYLWILILALGIHGFAQETKETLIYAGKLLAVPGQAVKTKQTIVLSGDKIVAIRDGYLKSKNAKIIDLSKKFVLPGLIDCHVHATFELGPRNLVDNMTMEDADVALRASVWLQETLEAGFTTVRDLGSKPTVIFPLKRGINKGFIAGPRLVAAGSPISITGGHGDTNGLRHELLDLFVNPGVCNGADDCRRAVRQMVKLGADVIKVTATGGVLSDVASGTGQHFFDDELEAIVQTAHSLGRKVAAHAHNADGINTAVAAGVDSIEHGTFSNDQSATLFKEKGAYFVPTLLAGETVMTLTFLPPSIRAKAQNIGPKMADGFKTAYSSGVKIAFGTDSGVSAHGENAKEFALMVGHGMSPMEAITSATVSAADLLGLSSEIGSIEAGKTADIVATDLSPLDDILQLENISFVMKAGKVYKD